MVLTVGDLKKRLEGIPDEAEVCRATDDSPLSEIKTYFSFETGKCETVCLDFDQTEKRKQPLPSRDFFGNETGI